jgi:PAS domain S-box-containing protein
MPLNIPPKRNSDEPSQTERNVTNDRLRLAMESSKSVGWDWDLRTNRVLRFGDLSTGFGMSPDPSVGHIDDFRRWMHPEDRDRVWKALRDAMEARSPCAAEFRVVWPNGTVRWVSAKGQFYHSPAGDPERMVGIAVDITERKHAEEALLGKELELKETQRLAGVGSWHWDPETDTVVWSEELYRIAGRDPNLPAVNYREHAQLYTPESWERLRSAVETALQAGVPYELDMEMVRADGTRRRVTGRGEVQRDSTGRIVGLRGTLQDITERKHAEQALSSVNRQLIQAQDSERARIARELHDDIGQRLGLLAMAVDQVMRLQPESAADTLRSLKGIQAQVAEIIVSVQALSHELHSPRLLHLGLVAAMRGFCGELSEQKNVAIAFGHRSVPDRVPADVALCLFRVLQEALHNAVRHSGVRQAHVHVRGAGDALRLTVRDEGVGFDVAAASGRRGLGLISMRERLKLVGGEFLIESQPKQGTTIVATVPVR